MKTRKPIILALAVFMAVIVVITGSTFAWFTATDGKKNHFETAKITDGTAILYEVFKEPKEWMPGQTIIKNVAASNTGANDILARISFEEVLDKLSSEVKYSDKPYAVPQVPVEFDAYAYAEDPEWKTPAEAGLTVDADVTTALGAVIEATMLVKTVTITDTVSPVSTSTGYSIIIWNPITGGTYDGVKQSCRADFYVEGSVIKMVPGTLKFFAFDGRETTKTAWADFRTETPYEKTGSGAEGTKQVFDAEFKLIETTADSHLDALIHFNYDALTDTPQPGKWFYNIEDGWFYYIGKIEPGSITPLLLYSVTLDETANSQYSDMVYDLYVNMEAIQPLESAVASVTGWNLEEGTVGKEIVAALVAAGSFDVVE
jgi:predicted ribosomally synthesized peptide with SipW-like signal peptide